MGADLQPCGTRAAYQRHKRHGEDPCEDCKAANRQDTNARGSDRYKPRAEAHRRLKASHLDEFAALYDKKNSGARGWYQAMSALIRNYPDEFKALLAQCKAESETS